MKDRLLPFAAMLLLGACGSAKPIEVYSAQAKKFAALAVRRDSAGMRSLAASDTPVRWLLDAVRDRPAVALGLRGATFGQIVDPVGDTTAVVYHGVGECSERAIIVRFVGAPGRSRIVSIDTDCGAQ